MDDKQYEPKCPQCNSNKLARYAENPTGDPAAIKLMCMDCFVDFFDLRDSATLSLPEVINRWE